MFVPIDGKFFIPVDRVSAVIPVGSAQARRIKELVAGTGMLLNLTYGKSARSMIVMDSGHVILTHIEPEELVRIIWERR